MIRNLLEALKSRQVPLFSDAKVGLQRLYLILYIAILLNFVADLIFSYFRKGYFKHTSLKAYISCLRTCVYGGLASCFEVFFFLKFRMKTRKTHARKKTICNLDRTKVQSES